MDLSVLIPTFQRPDQIDRCLEALSRQQGDRGWELIIGLDGSVDDTPEPRVPEALQAHTRLVRIGRVGLPRLRRAMMERAHAGVVLWLNDDAEPRPGLIDAHARAHTQSGSPRVVAGRASWKTVERPNLFDRLVQGSDLVFFRQGAARESVDYRNCYGLNMSFPRDLCERVGGVAEVAESYGYEDIELAWRMARAGASCIYEPSAEIIHDHRYTALDVHRREYLLGRAAWAFSRVNPAFTAQLLRADLRQAETLRDLGCVVRALWSDALRIERSFIAIERQPADSVREDLLPVLGEHWVLLKRVLWRWGVLDAARGLQTRWSLLCETSPDMVLGASPAAV